MNFPPNLRDAKFIIILDYMQFGDLPMVNFSDFEEGEEWRNITKETKNKAFVWVWEMSLWRRNVKFRWISTKEFYKLFVNKEISK